MAGLLDHIRRRIQLEGPMSVAEYMHLCLAHPEHGYYRNRDPFGEGGDFITAPEISQMFGELVGLWAVAVWESLGAPNPVQLVELGPGRGTLMSDALRAANQAPAFLDALKVNFIETSPILGETQAAALSEFGPSWHEDLTSLAAGPAIFIANEFFDALPIRQFERSVAGWQERLIGADSNGDLQFQLSPPQHTNPYIPSTLETLPGGAVFEINTAAQGMVGEMTSRIVGEGGAALIIDYGYVEGSNVDTLQAVKEHAYHNVLQAPGDADITAHVDFSAISMAALDGGAQIYGPVGQGNFLRSLGIRERAQQLSANASERQAADIGSALNRLTAPDSMGDLFKVMALTSSGGPMPPGFQ